MSPQRYGFLVLPPFGLLSLAAAVEALLIANEALERRQFEPLMVVLEGVTMSDDAGRYLAVPRALPGDTRLDGAFVVTDHPPRDEEPLLEQVARYLAPVADRGGVLGGIGVGAAWLARAGFLSGYRCTLHRSHVAGLAEQRPDVVVSYGLYEIDRQRITCPGGSAALDMMIAWIERLHGAPVKERLVAHFGLDRHRPGDQRQRVPDVVLPGGSAKLAEAVTLMEANIAEPLGSEEIARLVGVSRRQLERLFKQHVGSLPSRWYLELRLAHARRLLQETSQSVLQVGLSSGFSSAAHFSNAYRSRYGRTPREERSPRAAAWREAGRESTATAEAHHALPGETR